MMCTQGAKKEAPKTKAGKGKGEEVPVPDALALVHEAVTAEVRAEAVRCCEVL